MCFLVLLPSLFVSCWSLAVPTATGRRISVPTKTECSEGGCGVRETLAQEWRRRHHVLDDQVPNVTSCPRTMPRTARVALILYGDSFRNSNHQLENGTCDEGSVKEQEANTESHLLLLSSLESAGYAVRAFGATYPCANGAKLADSLALKYGDYMEKLHVMPRSDKRFGGQVYAIANATATAVASINKPEDEFEYYLLWRWDMRVTTVNSSFWPCAFDSQPFVRNEAHMHGYTSSGGRFNNDWFMFIPGQTVRCFVSAVYDDPESCCVFREYGPACNDCADKINQRFYGAEYSPCTSESSVGCPAVRDCSGQLAITKVAGEEHSSYLPAEERKA